MFLLFTLDRTNFLDKPVSNSVRAAERKRLLAQTPVVHTRKYPPAFIPASTHSLHRLWKTKYSWREIFYLVEIFLLSSKSTNLLLPLQNKRKKERKNEKADK